ncbi:MAG: PAS domain S-box protein, partial [Chloroflexota bacterium]|nr:PAS domain S-box protein [Chloroflexota bacterium]
MNRRLLANEQNARGHPSHAGVDSLLGIATPEVLEPAPDLSRRLSRRELVVDALLAGGFCLAALGLATVPDTRPPSLVLAAVLGGFYALASRITFAVGAGFAVPTQLMLVPMLFLLPPAIVPLVVASALLLGTLRRQIRRKVGMQRGIADLADSWHAIGPALVFVVADVRGAAWEDWPVYLAALAGQFAFDLAASTMRECFGRGISLAVQLRALGWVYLVDALLAPVGLLAAVAAVDKPYAVLLLLPLMGLLGLLSRERSARIRHAFDLSRAYRGAAIDLRTRLEQLRESDERFRLLIASVKDYAIVMLDPDGRVTTWNQGAERIAGYVADEAIGEHVSLFYLPADIERGTPERTLRKAATDGSCEEEGWRLRKGGSRFFAHVVTTALLGDGGTLRGFATVTRDVTERKQLEAQLVHRALHD